MSDQTSAQSGAVRHPRLMLSPLSLSALQLRNPFMLMWWSAALPGYGHLMLGKYVLGFVLVCWECFANLNSHLNKAIVLSMVGDFEGAKSVAEVHWLMLYTSVYVFAIWDVYSRTIDLNKVTILAIRENGKIPALTLGSLGIHGLRPVAIWKSVALTAFLPGLGQLYMQRIITGLFAILWWLVSCYYSHFPEAMFYTLIGDLKSAYGILDFDWLLFLPSIYGFALYDALTSAVCINRYFETEQGEYLKREHQHPAFRMPI